MRRSLIIAVAILATMTLALVALAVEPFVDGDTLPGADLDVLLADALEHPELFGSDAAPPTDSAGDGASGGSDDSSGFDGGGDQPQD